MRVRVSAPSHVHIGNPDMHGGVGRLYGTLGFTLEEPRLVIEAWRGERRVYSRSPFYREKGTMFLDKVLDEYNCEDVTVRVVKEIPWNIGLGATTALALSIGVAATSGFCKEVPGSIEELAISLGRGTVSGLGVYGFKHGGFIVDGGFRGDRRGVPPLIYRAHVPARYKMLVAVPLNHVERIRRLKSGEDRILDSMPRMSEDLASKLSRIVLMGVIPNIQEGEWRLAGEWITVFNRELGRYWSRAQGGIYCCRDAEDLIGKLLSRGALLACQSSWGPTVYGLFEDPSESLLTEIKGEGVDAWLTSIDNRGAVIEVIGDG